MHVPNDYKKLTPTDVFMLVIEIWTWMSEDSSRVKHKWPRWIANGGDIPTYENDCATCEHNLQNTYHCSDCLLPWRGGHCTEGEHEDWRKADTDKEKRDAALSIVKLAENELRKIGAQEGSKR